MKKLPSRWLRHLQPMTSAQVVLAALRDLPFGKIRDLTGDCPIMVLAPHPDDETLGCGGLLAAASRLGLGCHVRIVTDGTGSHPAVSPARLKAMRETETRNAMSALGIETDALDFLGVTDGSMPRSGPTFDRLVDDLAREVDQLSIRTIFATWRHDPHPDHQAVARLARVVADRSGTRLFYYPIWGWTLSELDWLPTTALDGFRLDITDQLEQKRRAIACHASQFDGHNPGGFTMPAEIRAYFERPVETFVAG